MSNVWYRQIYGDWQHVYLHTSSCISCWPVVSQSQYWPAWRCTISVQNNIACSFHLLGLPCSAFSSFIVLAVILNYTLVNLTFLLLIHTIAWKVPSRMLWVNRGHPFDGKITIICSRTCDVYWHITLVGASLSEPHINGTTAREIYVL